jgi:hypothetical protein
MTNQLLANLPNYTDECGCSLLDGRCDTHASMMSEIHAAVFSSNVAADLCWSLQDGYGIPGYGDHFDWSGIRDSSTSAIEAMFKAIHA